MSSKKQAQDQRREPAKGKRAPNSVQKHTSSGVIDPDAHNPYSHTQMVDSWTK